MKLSIVIALYNTEAFIEKCIRSIYSGNVLHLHEFEVLVINDGSTDGSRAVVENLQKEFTNLFIINKENGGQSSARNIGFKIAKGQYIFCVDSDDFVNAEHLKCALEYSLEYDLDMLPIYFKIFDENYHMLKEPKDNYREIEEPISGFVFMEKFIVSGTMWRYFYKKNIIVDNNLSLMEGVLHEDEEFVLRFMTYCKKISYKPYLVYNYIIRSSSTVNKKDMNHRKKLLKDIIIVIESLMQRSNEINNKSIGLELKIEQLLVSVFLRMKREGFTRKDVDEIILLMREKNLFPLVLKYQTIKFKLSSIMFNTSFFRYFFYKS